MLLVQEYLKNHSFADLAREHGVYASFSKSGHKFSLNYDMLEAKEADPLAQECRGLILAAEDGRSFLSQAIQTENKLSYDHLCPGETRILGYPMKRFFNWGQGSAAEINWSDSNLAVMEKLDGTLCIVYYDPFINKWCVATRSVPEADLIMDNGIFTFRTLFEKALMETTNLSFDDFVGQLNTRITYCFELTTPYNRIVVYYPKCRLTLLSARSLSNNNELNLSNLGTSLKWVKYDNLDQKTKDDLNALGHNQEDTPEAFVPVPFDLCGVPLVRKYTYTSVNELVEWVSTLNPIENEGVVVCDSNFNRIKVKNAAYVAYNKARDMLGTSERNCLEIILAEKDDDVIPFLPEEIVKNLVKIKEQLQSTIKEYDEQYLKLKTLADAEMLGDKKTFALLVNQAAKDGKLWTAPFFQFFSNKSSNMKDFIQKNKQEGTWSNSFLDKLLEISKNKS